jgi:hypothetical protein
MLHFWLSAHKSDKKTLKPKHCYSVFLSKQVGTKHQGIYYEGTEKILVRLILHEKQVVSKDANPTSK